MKRNMLLLLSFLILQACQNGQTSEKPQAATAQAEGFERTAVPGSDWEWVVKKDPNGRIVEEGFLRGDKKEGTWVRYHTSDDKQIPKSVQGFHNGLPNGVLIEYGNRGQLQKIAHYLNGQLHGRYATYDYGRMKEIRHYQNGQLHGLFTKYYPKSDQIQSTTEFKNGKQHGIYRYYDEEGNITLEYEYKNGEKVRGGMIKKK